MSFNFVSITDNFSDEADIPVCKASSMPDFISLIRSVIPSILPEISSEYLPEFALKISSVVLRFAIKDCSRLVLPAALFAVISFLKASTFASSPPILCAIILKSVLIFLFISFFASVMLSLSELF